MKKEKSPGDTLFTQLAGVYTSLILVGFAIVMLFAGGQITAFAWQSYRSDLQRRAENAAHSLEWVIESFYRGESDDDEVDAALNDIGEANDLMLFFYPVEDPQLAEGPGRGEGQGYGRNPDQFISQPPPPESVKDLREFQGLGDDRIDVYLYRDDSGRPYLATATTIESGPHIIGYLRTTVGIMPLVGILIRRWLPFIGGLLAIMLGVLFASRRIAARIAGPLERLGRTARQLAKGDLSARADNDGPREISDLANTFNRMAEQVESMIEEQRAFASNASHELRTPLTTLRLRVEALREDKSLDETTRSRYLNEMDGELTRMTGLIEDLILLSRFDAGRAEIGQENIDMRRFALNLDRLLAPRLEEKGITLSLVMDEDEELVIRASLNHIYVVFRNILDNAIKFTPPGGHITWSICHDAGAVISGITDTGAGIDTEMLPQVTRRFFRGDPARSRDIPGTGLGLSLVQSILAAYKGTLTISSMGADKGTTVTIRWPSAPVN